MAKQFSVVVGSDPHSDLIGFNTEGDYVYGVSIPSKLNDELVSQITVDTVANTVELSCAGLTGTKYDITTDTGVAVTLTGSAGEYTATDATLKTAMLDALNGMFNMMLAVLAVFTSAQTVSESLIVVTLDEAPDATDVANWSVDINTGTPNAITGISIAGNTINLLVADIITVGQTITVSHTAVAGDEVDTITAQAVTNNEV